MNRIFIRHQKTKINHIIRSICAILFLSFSHNCCAQLYLDTNKTFATEEDFSKSIDGLFHKAILDSTKNAWALLMFKIDESGTILSAHIFRGENIDPSMFYSICATIEDCYDTPFFKKTREQFQEHTINGILRCFLKRDFPKSSSQEHGTCSNTGDKDKLGPAGTGQDCP